jgi:NAD(P)-dependent dehydrogenase (short-subunit alcohol dehydrogenase family)
MWQEHVETIRPLIESRDFDEAKSWVDENAPGLPATASGPGGRAYQLSKSAVTLYSILKAQELGPRGIRVNTVSPHGANTPMYLAFLGRADPAYVKSLAAIGDRKGTATDIAYALAFLGSGAAAYINATNLPVDGGFTAAIAAGAHNFKIPAS